MGGDAAFDPAGEFDRQVRTLLDRGYPEAAGLGGEEFAALVDPLREVAVARTAAARPPEEGRVPFVLVVTRALVPVGAAMARTALAGRTRPGVVDQHLYGSGGVESFLPADGVTLPDRPAYLLVDVERGEEFCGVVPDEAVATVAGRGRTPLTIEEGVALVTHHPAVLARNRCFSLAGSRAGDRRVPAIWISRAAPKLGWCWAGNPHTWLGMASAAGRAAAAAGDPAGRAVA